MYYNKVEICGVNTAKLKILTDKEKRDLLIKAKNGDEQARQDLIYGNLRLVLSIIQRFSNRRESMDDLFQVGVIGLIKSVDNFDVQLDVRFSTYAVPMIIGEIRRYLRDNSKIRISRSIKDTAYQVFQYKEKYIQEHGIEPSIEQIAEALEREVVDIVIALEAIQEPVSIYTPIFNNGGDEIYLADQIPDENDSEEKRLNKMIIEEGIKNLDERLKGIIYSRYYDNKTQMEIAEELGISQAQVSRLEKTALRKIFNLE